MNPEFVAALVAVLARRGETVAAAESLTGGLVCAELTSVPGSSAVVRGGLIVYATELKASLAGVDVHVLERRGAVHPVIAGQLATGARRRCGADWGIGLTGVAGPDPQDGVDPGTVHIALAGGDVLDVRTIEVTGNRQDIRSAAVNTALTMLWERVSGENLPGH